MRLLLINYDFPPALSGVRRIVKFAKYLPEFGIEPLVLSARPARNSPLDYDALAEVEAQKYPVFRTASLDLQHLVGWLSPRSGKFETGVSAAPPIKSGSSLSGGVARFARRVLVPDDRIGWLPFANRAADRILRTEKVDAILTSSFPNTAHLVGLHIRKRHQIPWIADFRDGWTQNPYFSQSLTKFHTAISRRQEAKVVRTADAVTTVSGPIAQYLTSLDPERPLKVHVLPNGFDPDDYDGIEPLEFDRFTIAYTGTLFLQRSPEAFFWAVRGLLDEYPAMRSEFQIIFRTKFPAESLQVIEELGLSDVVQNWGLGTHRDALQLQSAADALLILESDGPNAEIMLTQKVFEYLSAGKPILAVAPVRGALAELVRRTRSGVVVTPDEIFRIKEALYDLFNGQARLAPNAAEIRKLTRREQARELALILKSL